ncbi:uncharacterized protein [Epargyreus clarus]|uniref:uncharacterized protein n=1 Tax=Epargyreus clarus TaxID=520877 RepID=UPI003C2C17C7
MDKPSRHKTKNKKAPAKPKTPKKRKSDGPTCSMYLAELTRRLAKKKKLEAESPRNVVHLIIDSITNALPLKFSRRSPTKKDSPVKIETLQTYAPELLPNDMIEIPPPVIIASDLHLAATNEKVAPQKSGFKMPKMPLVNSDVFKAPERRNKIVMEDASVNTSGDHDVASEIAKHVGTLRKISLIAEEFNQKTAKNLKEIVDSVQEDLIKKLEEIKAEEKAKTEKVLSIAEEPIAAQ